MTRVLDDTDQYTQVPEHLKDAITDMMFRGIPVVYEYSSHYPPSKSSKKSYIISDRQSDGSILMKRYIVSYVEHDNSIEVFHITEDTNKL